MFSVNPRPPREGNYPVNFAGKILFSVYARLVIAPYDTLLTGLDSVRVRLPISSRSQDILLKVFQTLFPRTLFSPFLALLWAVGVFCVAIPTMYAGLWEMGVWIFGGVAVMGFLVTCLLAYINPAMFEPVTSEEYRLKHEKACRQVEAIRYAMKIPESQNDALRIAIEVIMDDDS